MTKKLLSLLFISLSFSLMSQVTINSNEYPMPTGPKNLLWVGNSAVKAADRGKDKLWNFKNDYAWSTAPLEYYPETIQELLDIGIDAYRQRTKNFNPNFIFNYYEELDFDANGVNDVATYIELQPYELSALTGSTLDSLIIPFQVKLNPPTTWMQFPMTKDKQWKTDSRRVTDFTLSVAAYNLKKAPASIVWHLIRQDSVIGYGKLTVKTPDGITKTEDVLLTKIAQYSIDSFFLLNAPAPTALLNAFSLKQGQKTNVTNRYNLYAKNAFPYRASFFFGSNNFTTASDFYVDTVGIQYQDPTATNETVHQYSSLLFPNPSLDGNINISFFDINVDKVNVKIYDLNGKLVKDVKSLQSNSQSSFTIDASNLLDNQMYLVNLSDEKGQNLFHDKVFIGRKD